MPRQVVRQQDAGRENQPFCRNATALGFAALRANGVLKRLRVTPLPWWVFIAGTVGSTLAVVTSPMHTRRACATFEAVGVGVVCVPAEVRESGLHPDANAEDRLRAFRSLLYELFASSSYKSRGWIR